MIIGQYFGAAVVMLVTVWHLLRRAANARDRRQLLQGLQWTYAAYAAAFCISSLALFPTIDHWHDLPALARQIHFDVDTEHAKLALLNPDETTLATVDRYLRAPYAVLTTDMSPPQKAVNDWFAAEGASARVLVLLPGHASGELTPLLERAGLYRPPGDGVAAELEAEGVALVVRHYQLPHGRRYALLAPPDTRYAH